MENEIETPENSGSSMVELELESVPFPGDEENRTRSRAFRFRLLILHRQKWTLMHQISAENDDPVRRLLLIKLVHEVRKEAQM